MRPSTAALIALFFFGVFAMVVILLPFTKGLDFNSDILPIIESREWQWTLVILMGCTVLSFFLAVWFRSREGSETK